MVCRQVYYWFLPIGPPTAPFMLKLKFRKYPAIHTNYITSHSTTLYNIIIIFDTVLRQKRNIEQEK